MTLKPNVITQEQVVEQMLALVPQKQALDSTLAQLEKRIHLIENSLKENDQPRTQVKELIHISLEHFNVEWKRKSDFFPEIRLAILQKTLELAAPAPKK